MRYTNVKLPMETLYMDTYEDICLLVRTLAGHECDEVLDASSGYAAEGGWEEGDIDFLDINGRRRTLSYDYVPVDDTWETGRVFRYVVFDNE